MKMKTEVKHLETRLLHDVSPAFEFPASLPSTQKTLPMCRFNKCTVVFWWFVHSSWWRLAFILRSSLCLGLFVNSVMLKKSVMNHNYFLPDLMWFMPYASIFSLHVFYVHPGYVFTYVFRTQSYWFVAWCIRSLLLSKPLLSIWII